MKYILSLLLFLVSFALSGADIKAGVARKSITPSLPFWLTGYASRDKPSTYVLHDLWAKAIVFEEKPDNYVVIVTTDLLGLSHEISEEVAKRVNQKYGIPRANLLLNSSHTHSGPVVWPCLSTIFDFSIADMQAVAKYSQKLTDDIVEAIGMALNDIEPVQISTGHGSADFAINRRQQNDGQVVIGVNPGGPVDHDVPVILISTHEGKLKAVVFSYACHNTSSNTYMINGDYAGFAQIELEKLNPGATALFIAGCGADQNPDPRGSLELAEQHGKSLAGSVQKVIKSGDLKPVHPPVRTYFALTSLNFLPFDHNTYQEELLSEDKYKQRRAKLMLEAYNKGYDVTRYQYPVQVIRFSKDLTILALGGEVVVDYPIEVKEMYAGENLFVAGYCNEVQCYIPSKRILKEGGYEPESSMIYYGYPGPFADNVEEKIIGVVKKGMKHTGARLSKR
jgi:neutral ceramidase